MSKLVFIRKNIIIIMFLILLCIFTIPRIFFDGIFIPDNGEYKYDWGVVRFDVYSVSYQQQNNTAKIQWIARVIPSVSLPEMCSFVPIAPLVTKNLENYEGRKSQGKGCPEQGRQCNYKEGDLYFAWIGEGVPLNSILDIQFSASTECELEQEQISSQHTLTGAIKNASIWYYIWEGLLSV